MDNNSTNGDRDGWLGQGGTKTWNDLKPPKTTYNHLQPPQKFQQRPIIGYRPNYKKYNWHALAFHFVRWLIVHGTRESKISGGGGGFVPLSYFIT